MNTVVTLLMVACLVGGPAMLIYAGWFGYQSNRTLTDRLTALDHIYDNRNGKTLELVRAFNLVTYEAHLRARMRFRDPWTLYPTSFLEAIGKLVPVSTKEDLNTIEVETL